MFTVNEINVDKPGLVKQNKQPITGELTNQSELARSSDVSSDSELNKQCEQTIKSIINPSAINAAKMESSDSETCDVASTIEFASKPPLKTPMFHLINQIDFLQTLGNYTSAALFETDEVLQKVITLIQQPNSTKINRLPAPWRDKFKCYLQYQTGGTAKWWESQSHALNGKLPLRISKPFQNKNK